MSDGECWLHNVNIALCTSDVKRLRGPCLRSDPAASLGHAPGRGSGRLDRAKGGVEGSSFPPAVGWHRRHASTGKFFQHDEMRSRRLLLHKAPDSSPSP